MEEPNVNEKEKAVAIAYCGEALGNAERACIIAGYSPRTARGSAYKIVARDGVQQYIKWLNHNKLVASIATIEEIQAFWTGIMKAGDVDMKHRLRASELLSKVLIDNVEEW